MKAKEDIELKCLKEGLLNEFALRRMTSKLIKEFCLPDGRYDLESSSAYCTGDGYILSMELVLPKDRPIRYGTAVIGGTTHLCLVILAYSSDPFMDLVALDFKTAEISGETYHYFTLSLHEGRAGELLASSM